MRRGIRYFLIAMLFLLGKYRIPGGEHNNFSDTSPRDPTCYPIVTIGWELVRIMRVVGVRGIDGSNMI